MRVWVVWTSVIVGWCLGIAPAPAAGQAVDLYGQVRPRAEVRDLGGGSKRVHMTSMRVRAAVNAALERGARVFVQFQDVRTWGEETSTLTDFSADQLDLHQGYVQLGLGQSLNLTARVGRQETNLGGQRLVGAVGWTQQGRSFDGVRITGARGRGAIDLVGYKLREGDPTDGEDAEFLGAYLVVDVEAESQLDLYLLHQGSSSSVGTEQTSYGARLHGARNRIAYRGEVTLQRGTRAGADVSAHMFGARIGSRLFGDRGSVTLWYDHLSGDDEPTDGKVRVFDTLFATNHKFYGLADLFLDIPAHTGGRGLRDAAVKTSYAVTRGVTLNADLHHFSLAAGSPGTSSTLGQELDLTLTYPYADGIRITSGYSVVWSDAALRDLGRARGTVHFGYLMLDASF